MSIKKNTLYKFNKIVKVRLNTKNFLTLLEKVIKQKEG